MEAVAKLAEQGDRAVCIRCDVRSSHDCAEAATKTVERLGKINVLCNNAGIVIRKTVLELQEDEWDLVLDVTLKSVYRLSREVIPHMIRSGGGSIINTSSGCAFKDWARAPRH